MKTIKLEHIQIAPERQRRIFDEEALSELIRDIKMPHGLLHPIILRSDERTLVSGERRLRAVTQLAKAGKAITHSGEPVPLGHIPYLSLSDLSLAELEEAELAENICRVDLSWQERVEAITRLAGLRRKQGNSDQEISREVGDLTNVMTHTVTKLHDTEALAANLHRPAVRAAKTQSEAIRTLRRELEQELMQDLADKYKPAEINSEHRLLQGDCRTLLPTLPAESFDCIIADPPYGIGANQFGNQAELDHEYADDPKTAEEIYRCIIAEGARITKKQAHLYLFCDLEWFFTLKDMLSEEGTWVPWPRPLIWYKGTAGLLPRPHHGPRYSYEVILFASKGDRETLAVFLDVLDYPSVRNRVHAAQKPVALYEDLIRRTCRPGDFVLDPTCGSGTIFPAATATRVRATGIESNRNAHAYAQQRMLGDEL